MHDEPRINRANIGGNAPFYQYEWMENGNFNEILWNGIHVLLLKQRYWHPRVAFRPAFYIRFNAAAHGHECTTKGIENAGSKKKKTMVI